MGHLGQDAGAVACVDLAAGSAAVVKVAEDLQRLLNDVMGFLPIHVHDETDTTGVVFELRIIQALLRRQAVRLSSGQLLHCIVIAIHVAQGNPTVHTAKSALLVAEWSPTSMALSGDRPTACPDAFRSLPRDPAGPEVRPQSSGRN